jgi:hypothetical protein
MNSYEIKIIANAKQLAAILEPLLANNIKMVGCSLVSEDNAPRKRGRPPKIRLLVR